MNMGDEMTTEMATETQSGATTERLGDRIVAFLTEQTHRARAQWSAEGLEPLYYATACHIGDIAEALGVTPMAVNGAVGHLHRAGTIVGLAVRAGDGSWPSKAYVIALRAAVTR